MSKNDVEIIRDNGSKVKKPMYKQIQEVIGQGGMIDGRGCSEDAKQAINLISIKPSFSQSMSLKHHGLCKDVL